MIRNLWLVPAVMVFSAFSLSGQTTAISATAMKDQQGNLITGSICLGQSYATPTTCQPVTAGAISSFSLANGTYTAWVNEGNTTIFTTTNAVLSGTPIQADVDIQALFAATVGGTFVYAQSQQAIFTCNGNAVNLAVMPVANATMTVVNLSTTTGCTISGQGNSLITQGVAASSKTLPAGQTTNMTYTLNYDYANAGHNAWIVTHLGT